MKKLLLCFLVLSLSSLTSVLNAQGCVVCKNNHDRECQRVVVGDVTHIFYGDKEECSTIE